jgi:hypothetical protein
MRDLEIQAQQIPDLVERRDNLRVALEPAASKSDGLE